MRFDEPNSKLAWLDTAFREQKVSPFSPFVARFISFPFISLANLFDSGFEHCIHGDRGRVAQRLVACKVMSLIRKSRLLVPYLDQTARSE